MKKLIITTVIVCIALLLGILLKPFPSKEEYTKQRMQTERKLIVGTPINETMEDGIYTGVISKNSKSLSKGIIPNTAPAAAQEYESQNSYNENEDSSYEEDEEEEIEEENEEEYDEENEESMSTFAYLCYIFSGDEEEEYDICEDEDTEEYSNEDFEYEDGYSGEDEDGYTGYDDEYEEEKEEEGEEGNNEEYTENEDIPNTPPMAAQEPYNDNGQTEINYQENDASIRLLASLVFCEAGSESYNGKLAVAIVVMNRVRSDKFPDSIKGVIYQRSQFGPVSNGRLNQALALYDSNSFTAANHIESINAAKEALDENIKVSINGEKVDFSKYLFFNNVAPSGTFCKLGGHFFK